MAHMGQVHFLYHLVSALLIFFDVTEDQILLDIYTPNTTEEKCGDTSPLTPQLL